MVKKLGLAAVIVVLAAFTGALAGRNFATINAPEASPALSSLAENQPEVETRWASFENPTGPKRRGRYYESGIQGPSLSILSRRAKPKR